MRSSLSLLMVFVLIGLVNFGYSKSLPDLTQHITTWTDNSIEPSTTKPSDLPTSTNNSTNDNIGNDSVSDKIGTFFSNIWNSISNFFSNIWNSISNFFGQLTTGEIVGIVIAFVLAILVILACCVVSDGCCRFCFVMVFGSLALGIAFIATPVAILMAGCLGFTATGVAASSCASRAQSHYGGGVSTGSIFSRLQSFGAGGGGYGSI